ncbi:uncharacterized protein BO95DRAFT_254919 [Aspergillus brunneoviolaceus CBS 621.78]|uniref:Uncharacterized protein n=1 Tax=Aspergillus brunneoviolaceus CBS 621.78 TaxID=1450534 RepID=A0ACD1FYD5_9EURO|nr:hypothetical protein BO95DRAFT_254919 [Aspergillus brunneoviolaceus CBS 621.78]RAH41926.1 hypothetical protein BO95DRAFT_254919 [Aspergillus brunneoviolaceus CBS 621.78]
MSDRRRISTLGSVSRWSAFMMFSLITDYTVEGAPIAHNSIDHSFPTRLIDNAAATKMTRSLCLAEDSDRSCGLLRKISEYKQQVSITKLVVLACLLAVCAVVYRICLNTMYCQRRRVDRAAQREERKARRAYKAAARRLRWHRWWERKPTADSPAPEPENELFVIDMPPEEPGRMQVGSDAASLPGAMQDELQNLRQTLACVGKLIGAENIQSATQQDLIRPDGDQIPSLHGKRRMSSETLATSTVGLSTITFTATSSRVSHGPGSSKTVKSGDTLDSAPPPSYRS